MFMSDAFDLIDGELVGFVGGGTCGPGMTIISEVNTD
jgi:hypothetical protein